MKRGKMTIISLLAGLVLILSLNCGNGDEDGNGNGGNGDSDGYAETASSGITLKWKVEGNLLHLKVSAETTGWVAVGFDPVNRMEGANIIIGYVEDGAAYIRDDYAYTIVSHDSDESQGGTDDVTNPAGTESGGVTEISFTIPLDSGDAYDKPLVPGNAYNVILARGPDASDTDDSGDNFTKYHQSRTMVQITL